MTPTIFSFVMLTLGLISIGIGTSLLTGSRRFEYIYPHYYSGGIKYASIPGGIMFLIWGASALLQVTDNIGLILTSISLVFGLAGLVLNFVQPRFMKPTWYRWLEDNHKEIIPLLRGDAQKIGYQKWLAQTQTQEGLEEWVATVRRKHGLEK